MKYNSCHGTNGRFCTGGSGGYTEFGSVSEFSTFANKTHSAWYKSLDENERDVVSTYAADTKWCRELNAYARGDSDTPNLENAKNILTSAIAKSNGLGDSVVGFRDVNTKNEMAKIKYTNLKPGDVFTEDAFTSIGARPTVGYRNDGSFGNVFGDFRIEARIPKGTKAVFPNPSSSEAEMLLQAGTKFKVISKSGSKMVIEVVGQNKYSPGYELIE